MLECLKALNQVGARLRWEEDGRILCQEAAPITGYNKPILDKVVHVGGDAFNLYIILFQMVTRPALAQDYRREANSSSWTSPLSVISCPCSARD